MLHLQTQTSHKIFLKKQEFTHLLIISECPTLVQIAEIDSVCACDYDEAIFSPWLLKPGAYTISLYGQNSDTNTDPTNATFIEKRTIQLYEQ